MEKRGSLVTLLNIGTVHGQKLDLAKEALQCLTWPYEPSKDLDGHIKMALSVEAPAEIARGSLFL